MYYLFRFTTLVLPWMPRWLVHALGNVGGLIAWLTATNAREQAKRNMIHVLGMRVTETRAGRRRLRRAVRSMFMNDVRGYLELFSLPSLGAEKILRTTRAEGLEHIDAGLAQGKGVILISAHLGPFEYIIHYAAIKGYDVTIPVERLEDQRILDLMLDLRRSHGIQFLPLGTSSTMRAIVQKLRSNKVVLITADRAIEGQSVETLFFGRPARLPIGPVTLAQRTGAALVGAFCWRTPDGLVHGRCVPLSLELTEEQRTNTDCMMRALIEKMEHFIREHPEQWLAFTPIWMEDIKSGS